MSIGRSSPQNAGFTLIETIIVLAIGGIILMIIFLAIPTLQRNSRNNQRNQDVGLILEAVSRYELNHLGGFPSNCGATDSDLCGDTKGDPLFYAEPRYYDKSIAGSIVIESKDASDNTATNPEDSEKIAIYNHQKCDANDRGKATSNGAGYNDVVALYALESSNGISLQCKEL